MAWSIFSGKPRPAQGPGNQIAIDPALMKSLLLLTSVVEARDPYTGGHVWRVAQFSRLLGRKIGLDANNLFLVTLGGYLHDLGKIGVPDAVLGKKGPLTDDEFAVMKTHPQVGCDIISAHPLGKLVLDSAAYHHERPDGRGYPHALDRIPILPLVIGAADTFDAMTSTRPYRAGMPIETALSRLAGEGGKQFDAKVLDALLELGKAGELDHIVGHSDTGRALATCSMCGPIIAVPRHKHDGDAVVCRSCGGEYRLHAEGDGFAPEMTGMATGAALAFQPDEAQVDDFVAGAELAIPASVTIEPPVWLSQRKAALG